MPTIKINDKSGTVAIGKGSNYTVKFFDFGSFYGGETKYLYDVNSATPVLLWSGEEDTLTLSTGSENKTMNLVAYDYCVDWYEISKCFYPSNTIKLIIGEGGTDMGACPRGDIYRRDFFKNCDTGYTLDPGLIFDECVCVDAIDKGRIEPRGTSKTDWGTIALIAAGLLALGLYTSRK